MTAEKWVVPDPIQYELLSLSQDADNRAMRFTPIDIIMNTIIITCVCIHVQLKTNVHC